MISLLSLSAERKTLTSRRGSALVEVIVATALFILIVSGFARLTIGSSLTQRQAQEQTAAELYAAEGLEAARSIGEQSFTNLTNGTFGLDQRFSVFAFSGSSNVYNGYTRQMTVGPVLRSNYGKLGTGGILDPYSKSIASTVNWTGHRGQPLSLSLTSEVTDFLHPRWLVDVTADFGRYRNGVVATANGDGEVRLEGLGNMKIPQSRFNVTLPTIANSQHVAIDPSSDRLYISTLNDNGAAEFYAYDTSDVSNNVLSLSGSTELGNTSNGFAIGRDYLYVLTSTNANEVRVVRSSTLTIASNWNLPSKGTPNDIAIDETTNRAYVVVSNNAQQEFYVLDIANPLSPTVVVVNQVEIGANATRVLLYQNYAFLAVANNATELQMINLSTMARTTCNLPGNQALTDIAIDSGILYTARATGAESEFAGYILNPSAPNDCAYLLGNINGQAQLTAGATEISVSPDHLLAFVLVRSNSNELQIVDLGNYSTTQANLNGSQCGGLTFAGKFLYSGCYDNTSSIQIWHGQGTAGFPLWGTYTSPMYDSGKNAALWEKVQWTQSGTGSISLRLRTANSSFNLKRAPWVGSGGLKSTTYASGDWRDITPDPGTTGTRWIQWKATFTGSGVQTPILEDTLLMFR